MPCKRDLPVRVDDRHHVDVVVVHNVLVVAVVLDELVDGVEDRSGADPLPGVDAAVDPDGALVGNGRIWPEGVGVGVKGCVK